MQIFPFNLGIIDDHCVWWKPHKDGFVVVDTAIGSNSTPDVARAVTASWKKAYTESSNSIDEDAFNTDMVEWCGKTLEYLKTPEPSPRLAVFMDIIQGILGIQLSKLDHLGDEVADGGVMIADLSGYPIY